jgi:hypothetical protein
MIQRKERYKVELKREGRDFEFRITFEPNYTFRIDHHDPQVDGHESVSFDLHDRTINYAWAYTDDSFQARHKYRDLALIDPQDEIPLNIWANIGNILHALAQINRINADDVYPYCESLHNKLMPQQLEVERLSQYFPKGNQVTRTS